MCKSDGTMRRFDTFVHSNLITAMASANTFNTSSHVIIISFSWRGPFGSSVSLTFKACEWYPWKWFSISSEANGCKQTADQFMGQYLRSQKHLPEQICLFTNLEKWHFHENNYYKDNPSKCLFLQFNWITLVQLIIPLNMVCIDIYIYIYIYVYIYISHSNFLSSKRKNTKVGTQCWWDKICTNFLLPGDQTGVQFSSVTQVCPILCNPMGCSTPGLPVHHQLILSKHEFTQTHVHWVSDAIQPSHPLSSPSPPTFNLSQHQDLFKWVSSSHQVTKVLEFQLQHQSFQWIFRIDFL